jgi:hypothetical protein
VDVGGGGGVMRVEGVDRVKEGGRAVHPLPSPSWAKSTIMNKLTPESGNCQSMNSLIFASINQLTHTHTEPYTDTMRFFLRRLAFPVFSSSSLLLRNQIFVHFLEHLKEFFLNFALFAL